ncbi:flagella basal body P-ring formation protein FlgA [Nitrosospira lacus]|uniref:Flagella basal body P-ring formation protein FlgA n=1 Tax=Nitrosospira lacus TaxID=1288494 RepID=A0A1W6SQH1_9PROT|nr:flagellar basal body P-ring formation chaperone FlgA [Nitrosospira lacus]ARO88022.1 flagella basal body P-ring formation protein FlgA [Nitrosospira lacus]
MHITYLRRLSLGLGLIAIFSGSELALASAHGKQDPRLIQEAVVHFLHVQSAGFPGQVEITPGAMDARINLPACAALEPSLPPGSRPWGNTTVIVNCAVPHPWTVYVRANVKVVADYVVSARPLIHGQTLTAADITTRRGDLTQLPPGIVTDVTQAFGRTMAGSIPFGSPVRQDMLRAQTAVMVNQSVKLVSNGRGFSVSAEGKALGNAIEGQLVQVRSASGPVVSGIARPGAIVEVSY